MAQWLIIYLLLYTHSTQVYAKIEQQQRSHLYHLNMNYDGEEIEDEFFSGTAEHPFWVVNQNKWVQMGDLKKSDKLLLHQGATPAYVLSNQRENAPPRETFTTYNFEVADFHTYFVGESGVWVHNTGKAPCEKVFSIYTRHRDRGLEPWEAFRETVQKTPGVPSQTYGLAAGEAMDEIYRLAAAGENVTVPTHTMVREIMKGRNIKFQDADIPEGSFFATIDAEDAAGLFRKLRLESHHGSPRQFHKWFGINDRATQNASPAYLTSFLEHRGKQVGIHQALEDVLGFPIKGSRPPGLTNQQIKDALRETYEEAGLGHFWEVCEVWLNTP